MGQQGREFIRTKLKLKTKQKLRAMRGSRRGGGAAGLQLDLLAELVVYSRRRRYGHALGTLALGQRW